MKGKGKLNEREREQKIKGFNNLAVNECDVTFVFRSTTSGKIRIQ